MSNKFRMTRNSTRGKAMLASMASRIYSGYVSNPELIENTRDFKKTGEQLLACAIIDADKIAIYFDVFDPEVIKKEATDCLSGSKSAPAAPEAEAKELESSYALLGWLMFENRLSSEEVSGFVESSEAGPGSCYGETGREAVAKGLRLRVEEKERRLTYKDEGEGALEAAHVEGSEW